MKIQFENDADYDVYKRDYYPLLVRNGFSWRMFPELGIYLDMKYPGWTDGINTNREHTNPNIPAIFARMITEEEWSKMGVIGVTYERFISGKPSSLPHEIAHYIHLTRFGADASLLWQKACAFMAKPMDFTERLVNGYWWKQSYEDFANYFEDCVEGRKQDDAFMDFVRGLFGIKFRFYREGEYILKDDRAHVPIRLITDTFKDGILRDIDWLPDTREVVVISGETGF
jgi:hypothetical protein